MIEGNSIIKQLLSVAFLHSRSAIHLISVSVDSPVLGISYKWNLMLCDSCLVSLPQQNVCEVHLLVGFKLLT